MEDIFELSPYDYKNEKSHCDIILNDAENVFESIDRIFDTALDENKTKMQVAGSIFGFGKNLLKFGYHTTACAAKNTPKAVVSVAKYKRELTDTITEEISKIHKEIKEDALDQKIQALAMKTKKHR